jgi:glycosyltransferase involved in cell wall biosynthesis
MNVEQPFITVVICTRDRAASLARTLESLVDARAFYPEDDWELLVVDNGSTDDTAATVERYRDRLPLRRIFEAQAGLSNARNAGVREAKGKYILWTDDDVRVDRQWLAAYAAAFIARPHDAIFGGRTEPVFEAPLQQWFADSRDALESLLAVRDEPDWVEIARLRVPYGLNYALRGEEQRRNLYDPALGVAPGRRRGGEEVDVINRILRGGGTGSWVWNATVYHLIPPERQTLNYIDTFYTSHGYDFPIGGASIRPWKRVSALLRAQSAAREAKRALRSLPTAESPEAVPWLILRARAKGSLQRLLFRKGP